jgi:SAM-dependent methyltransferase
VTRRSAPAALRNRGPIADVLKSVLPERGLVLEVASGTGEHALYFAGCFPELLWQPTDPDLEARDSIRAWSAEAALANLRDPLPLDAAVERWPVAAADAALCINMVHISPWSATEGLLRGAGQLLAPGAPLILYGPFRRPDTPTAPSNEAFDDSLKAQDPAWGLRDLEAVEAEASKHGLRLERVAEMPANNLTLVFRRV